jgi:hypothetical protein
LLNLGCQKWDIDSFAWLGEPSVKIAERIFGVCNVRFHVALPLSVAIATSQIAHYRDSIPNRILESSDEKTQLPKQ